MTYMLCRNRVADFNRWKAVFSSHQSAHLEAGLKLVKIWRGIEDRDDVFFLFEVQGVEMAKVFISNPEAAKTGAEAGVLEGEYHFVEDAGGY